MDPHKFFKGKPGQVETAVQEKLLRAEGFDVVYVQKDEPGVIYDLHTHPTRTAHIVLEGIITITVLGQTHTLKPSDRFDVPAGTPHSAAVGPSGCTYLVGEK